MTDAMEDHDMPCFIVIARGAWGKGATALAALTACRNQAGPSTFREEHFVYECEGDADAYTVDPINGALCWRRDAAEPVLVLHHRKGKRRDMRRRTMDDLHADAVEQRGVAGGMAGVGGV